MRPLAEGFAGLPDDGPVIDLEWYILVVSPMCEKAVALRLTRQIDPTWARPEVWTGTTSAKGIATYVPIGRRKVRRRGSRREVESLVMPRYLLAGFEHQPPWLYVREVRGVQAVLGVDGVPARIDATLVGALMWRCATGQLDVPEPPKIQRGMRVVASHGRLTGFEGEVTSLDRKRERVDVLFELFGTTPIQMRLDEVVSVSYSSRRTSG